VAKTTPILLTLPSELIYHGLHYLLVEVLPGAHMQDLYLSD